MTAGGFVRVVQSWSIPGLGSAALAHSSELGYLAAASAPKAVELYALLPSPTKLVTVTPPPSGLDFCSWSTIAAAGDAACVVYGASYDNSTRLARYLQVWRNGRLSVPTELVHNYIDDYNEVDQCKAIWVGTGWLVSTRVRRAGVTGVLLQRVAADGSRIDAEVMWTRPGRWLTGASLLWRGDVALGVGFDGDDRGRTVRLVTIDVATLAILSDVQVDDGSHPWVDTPLIGLSEGAVEVSWYSDGRLGGPNETRTNSRKDLGPIETRFTPCGELAAGQDSRVIVTKGAQSELVALVNAVPTVLMRHDGLQPVYRTACASSGNDWVASAWTGSGVRFWQLGLTDDPPPPPPPVPVEVPVGPLGPALPRGTTVDVASFFRIDDRCWPSGDVSRGDKHGMDLRRVPALERDGDVVWAEQKFGKDGQGKLLELMSMDAAPNGRIRLWADASSALQPLSAGGPYVDTWTDTTWLLKTMRIGREHGIVIECELVRYHPVTAVELLRIPFRKEMWIEQVWPKYSGGGDAGEGEALEYVYNNTGAGIVEDPQRYVERYRVFKGNDGRVWSWRDWDSNDSRDVFAPDGSHLFPVTPAQSDMYSHWWHLGGERFPVRLPNCPLSRGKTNEPLPVPTTELGITIISFSPGGVAPYLVTADFEVTGATGPFTAELTLDDATVATATATKGTMVATIAKSGTYRLGARIPGTAAKTGKVRLVTVTAAPPPPLPPTGDLLDVPLVGLFSDTDYTAWTRRFIAVVTAIRAWASRAGVAQINDGLFAHAMYRVQVETRWGTLRAILTEMWPTGAPK